MVPVHAADLECRRIPDSRSAHEWSDGRRTRGTPDCGAASTRGIAWPARRRATTGPPEARQFRESASLSPWLESVRLCRVEFRARHLRRSLEPNRGVAAPDTGSDSMGHLRTQTRLLVLQSGRWTRIHSACAG